MRDLGNFLNCMRRKETKETESALNPDDFRTNSKKNPEKTTHVALNNELSTHNILGLRR